MSTGTHESRLESPFLGELLFAREVEAEPARTDLILRDSPFTACEFYREEPIPDTAESQFVKQEKPDGDVASPDEIDFAELEEESPFRDPEAEAAPESLLESEGGITGGGGNRTEVRDTRIPPSDLQAPYLDGRRSDPRLLQGPSQILRPHYSRIRVWQRGVWFHDSFQEKGVSKVFCGHQRRIGRLVTVDPVTAPGCGLFVDRQHCARQLGE